MGGQTDGTTCLEAFLPSHRQSSCLSSHRHESLVVLCGDTAHPPAKGRDFFEDRNPCFIIPPGLALCLARGRRSGQLLLEWIRGAADAVSTLVSKAEEGTAGVSGQCPLLAPLLSPQTPWVW